MGKSVTESGGKWMKILIAHGDGESGFSRFFGVPDIFRSYLHPGDF
jgi:hypothetical protein